MPNLLRGKRTVHSSVYKQLPGDWFPVRTQCNSRKTQQAFAKVVLPRLHNAQAMQLLIHADAECANGKDRRNYFTA
jgi:hypothetical protein